MCTLRWCPRRWPPVGSAVGGDHTTVLGFVNRTYVRLAQALLSRHDTGTVRGTTEHTKGYIMGRGTTFSITDYADRIENYLNLSRGEVTTKEILEKIKGTNYRLIDGLFFLLSKGRVKVRQDGEHLVWRVND